MNVKNTSHTSGLASLRRSSNNDISNRRFSLRNSNSSTVNSKKSGGDNIESGTKNTVLRSPLKSKNSELSYQKQEYSSANNRQSNNTAPLAYGYTSIDATSNGNNETDEKSSNASEVRRPILSSNRRKSLKEVLNRKSGLHYDQDLEDVYRSNNTYGKQSQDQSIQEDPFLEKYVQDSRDNELNDYDMAIDNPTTSSQHIGGNTSQNVSDYDMMDANHRPKGTKKEKDKKHNKDIQEEPDEEVACRRDSKPKLDSAFQPITVTQRGLSPKFIQMYAHIKALAPDIGMDRKDSRAGLPSTLKPPKSAEEKKDHRSKSPPKAGNDIMSRRQSYYDILREIDVMKFNENIDEADEMITRAEKLDQEAHTIMEKKLGKKYANGLFYLLNQYSEDNGTSSNRMSPITLTKMLKDFHILNNHLNKERVMIIYSKRCKRNLIDDGAFIDILYKISHFFYGECQDKAERFQKFLDDYILAKIKDVLSKKTHKPSFSKIEVFDGEFSFENRSLRLFEGGDELLKHIFMLYSTYDFKYFDKPFLTIKSFRKFLQDFSVVPLLLRAKEPVEIFRRSQVGEYSIVDFRGFVKIIAIIAHIGFSKPYYKGKYDTYAKKVAKLFDFLQFANCQASDELVFNKLMQVRDGNTHVIA